MSNLPVVRSSLFFHPHVCSSTVWLLRLYVSEHLVARVHTLSAVLNLKVLNDGLARHEATRIVPTMYVLHTVLTIIGGELLYRTYRDLDWTESVCFGAGVVVSILGVYLLAQAPPAEDHEHEQQEEAAQHCPSAFKRALRPHTYRTLHKARQQSLA